MFRRGFAELDHALSALVEGVRTHPVSGGVNPQVAFAQRHMNNAPSIPRLTSNSKKPKRIHTTTEVRYLICGVCRITA